jgi:hypothetical protein
VALAAAHAVVSALADVDFGSVDDDALGDGLVELQELRARLDAAEAAMIGTWDGRQAWKPSGARSGAAWLAWQTRVPVADARRRVRHARACRDHPVIAEAWAKGRIDGAHVAALLRVRTPRTEAAFEADHPDLVEAAAVHNFARFQRLCRRWEATVDPDGAEQGADAARDARELHLSQTFGDMWFARGVFDPISGQILADTLEGIDRELFEADWAEARERLGREPTVDDLCRTPSQRRADALVEMAIRARTTPENGKRPRPLFTVVVGLETLQGPILELFNRTLVTPGTAAAWLSRADVERIVFDGPSRVLDVGEQRRFYRGALRRAIEVRDRTCYHPSCDQPPDRPEIDHITEAHNGGPTTQDNGRLACRYHNNWRNTHPDPPDEDEPDGPDPPGDPPDEPDRSEEGDEPDSSTEPPVGEPVSPDGPEPPAEPPGSQPVDPDRPDPDRPDPGS